MTKMVCCYICKHRKTCNHPCINDPGRCQFCAWHCEGECEYYEPEEDTLVCPRCGCDMQWNEKGGHYICENCGLWI